MFDEDALIRDALDSYSRRLRLDADLRSNRGADQAWYRKHLRAKASQCEALRRKYAERAHRNDETRALLVRQSVRTT